jgi:hypothetical protein
LVAVRRTVVKSELQVALEAYGRNVRELSADRLLTTEAGIAVLAALGADECLADGQRAIDFAAEVEASLRFVIGGLRGEDDRDRHIAEAVFATEEAFIGKMVEQRKQYLREHHGISGDVFKARRPGVVGVVALALARELQRRADAARTAEPTLPDGGGDEARAPVGVADDWEAVATQPSWRARLSRHRVAAIGAAVVTAALLAVAVAAFTRGDHAPATWNGMTAAELERRYDGKLPGGQDGSESHCADGDKRPSVPIEHATSPAVMGPDGNEVGRIQLRRSQACPTVVWARVLWHGDERGTYQIPAGWTLHAVMHRPDTGTVTDEPEPSKASAIEYALSDMLSSARGCVFAEAYFTNGDGTTAAAPTNCAQI